MKKILFLLMMPIIAFGQNELDSIAIAKSVDSIFQIAQQQLEYLNSGFDKHNDKDYYGAISDYTRGIELSPDFKGNSGLYHLRGFSKMKLGDYNGAITDYDKAIELKPDNDEYYFHRAMAKASEDYLGAVVDATKAIKLNPENADAYKIRGLSFTLLKSKCDALQCSDFKKCCDLGNEDCCEYYNEKYCN
jgi:tetratricopeptide (TPR) repeat protein